MIPVESLAKTSRAGVVEWAHDRRRRGLHSSGPSRRALGGCEGARFEKSLKVQCAHRVSDSAFVRPVLLGSASIGSRRHVRRAAFVASLYRLHPWVVFRWKSIALSLIVGVDNALAAQCYWSVA